jgi:hypothetical protein
MKDLRELYSEVEVKVNALLILPFLGGVGWGVGGELN